MWAWTKPLRSEIPSLSNGECSIQGLSLATTAPSVSFLPLSAAEWSKLWDPSALRRRHSEAA